jgi:hypothetical protein
MAQYEYKVVPAPIKGLKAKGVKTPAGRFANSVESVLNTMGGNGWEYLRAELLPSEERTGLTGSTTNWRNVLVFRRETTPAVDVRPVDTAATDDAQVQPASGAERMLKDDGVEELSPVSGMTAALKSRAKQQAAHADEDIQSDDEVADKKG